MRALNLAFLCLLIFSCKTEKEIDIPEVKPSEEIDSNLTGEWKLTARLIDPGDGSGEFVDVESDSRIIFYEDLTFESTQPLCVLIPSSHEKGSGKYSAEDSKIYPSNCQNDTELNFEIADGNLIIYYFCIEPCAEKYSKVDSNN